MEPDHCQYLWIIYDAITMITQAITPFITDIRIYLLISSFGLVIVYYYTYTVYVMVEIWSWPHIYVCVHSDHRSYYKIPRFDLAPGISKSDAQGVL